MKVKMVELWNRLKGSRAKMVLTVHDEICTETPEDELDDVVELLRGVLPFKGLSIPFPVSIKVGKNWGEMKTYEEG